MTAGAYARSSNRAGNVWRSCHCRREIDINESAHIKRHLLIIPQDAVVIPIEKRLRRGM